jgi:hypothetical protein
MDINLFEFIILSLASFRVTRLVVFDKITEFIRSPFFDEVEETAEDGTIEVYYVPKSTPFKKFFGELLSCYWCTGIWSSAFLILGFIFLPSYFEWILIFLAVAGFAALIETFIQFWMNN